VTILQGAKEGAGSMKISDTKREAINVLRAIVSPLPLLAVAVTAAAFYWFVCRPELEMRRADPNGWLLIHGSSSLPPWAHCVLWCLTGATAGFTVLFLVLYVYRIRSTPRQ